MAKFFIHKPVFAIVISLIILLAGGISILILPTAQYPPIAPPSVEVEINYPGANAETVEQSIGAVVEAEVNGAENMIYMSSKSSSVRPPRRSSERTFCAMSSRLASGGSPKRSR